MQVQTACVYRKHGNVGFLKPLTAKTATLGTLVVRFVAYPGSRHNIYASITNYNVQVTNSPAVGRQLFSEEDSIRVPVLLHRVFGMEIDRVKW